MIDPFDNTPTYAITNSYANLPRVMQKTFDLVNGGKNQQGGTGYKMSDAKRRKNRKKRKKR